MIHLLGKMAGMWAVLSILILFGTWIPRVLSFDCNGNGQGDVADIAEGHSEDCNGNSVPDECEGVTVELGISSESHPLSASPRQLEVGDLDQDGDLDIVVGSQTSLSLFFNVGDKRFTAAAESNVVGRLYRFTLGDLDLDGDLDIASANNDSVFVFPNAGDGSFESPNVIPLATPSRYITSGDVNGDGALDLVLSHRRENHVSILVNRGNGDTAEAIELPLSDDPLSPADPRACEVGDFDQDGSLDLAVLVRASDEVWVFLNQGDTAFGPPRKYPSTGSVLSSSTLMVEDLNADGFPDLILRVTRAFAVLLNRGDQSGEFSEPQNLGETVSSFAAADFDFDGDIDLAHSSLDPPGISVRANTGEGNFGVMLGFDLGLTPSAMSQGDFNRDGGPDLAIATSSPRDLRIVWNGESTELKPFTFAPEIIPLTRCPASTTCEPHSGTVADLDGDGDLDVLGCNTHPGAFSMAFNEGGALVAQDGYMFGGNSSTTGEHPQSVAAGDLDRDGDVDAVTVDNRSNDLWVHINRGDGSKQPFERPVRTRIGSAPINVRLADLDNDGDLDAVSANEGSASASILYNDGLGTFSPMDTRDFRVGASPKAVAVADLNGDGWIDIASANSRTTTVSILINNKDRTFEPRVDYRIGGNPNHVEAGDVDGDGDKDLVTANTVLQSVSVLYNAGDGTFEDTQDFSVGRSLYSLSLVDFDEDGFLDVITANELPATTSSISILSGDGNGGFGAPFHQLVSGNSSNGIAGMRFAIPFDVDSDGDWDIVTTNRQGQSFTLLYNNTLAEANYFESICTALDFVRLSVTSSGRDGVDRYVKYTLPVRDDPTLLPTLFQNTGTFRLHENFLREAFPDLFPALDADQYNNLVGRRASREYYVGAISRILTEEGRVYGFSVFADFLDPVERLTMEEVGEIHQRLRRAFLIEPFGFFPSSQPAEEVARSWVNPSFPIFFGSEGEAFSYEAYTRGVGFGRVRILDRETFEEANERGEFSLQDILVLHDAPRDIEGVVGGVVTAQPQGELSHVAIRTARRGTPNCFLKDAVEEFAEFEGKLVRLEVKEADFLVEEATEEQAVAFWDAIRQELSVPPVVDPDFQELSSFSEIAAMDSLREPLVGRFGGKASNLARLQTILDGEFSQYRESGFAIPVHYYFEFIRSNAMPSALDPGRQVTYEEYLKELFEDDRLRSDSKFRFEALGSLRSHMRQEGQVNRDLIDRIAARIQEVLGSPPTTRVRFRSSSNIEDAMEFNGAGLYTSTSGCIADDFDDDNQGPSICDPEKDNERGITRALKRVWSSLWNFRAYEERAFYRISQEMAAMGILVNRTFIDEGANGVAFTGNPSNPFDRRYVVTVQKGEESVVSPEPGVLPERDVLQVADGRVVDIIRSGRSSLVDVGSFVLSDEELAELGSVLYRIDQQFPVQLGGQERENVLLDIEFKIEQSGDLAVKQVRPFLVTGPSTPSPTFELEIPPGTVACGEFTIGRGPREEFELKSTLHFGDGTFFLPTTTERFAADNDLVREVVIGQARAVALPTEQGEFRVAKIIHGNGVVRYIFDYEQPFETEDGQPVTVRVSELTFEARDGAPVERRRVVDEDVLTHDLLIQAELGSAGEIGEILTYSSCTHDNLPLFIVRAQLEDGTSLSLEERFLAELASERDVVPASLVRADVRIADERRVVTDYFDLVYSADKHNAHIEYWIHLVPPVTVPDISDLVHVVHLTPPQPDDPTTVPGANYLNENLQPLRHLQIASFSKGEFAEEPFRRGDANADGAIDISDLSTILGHLFLGHDRPPCPDAADANDDGAMQVDDGVAIVLHLFRGDTALAEPFTSCGIDTTQDRLSCDSFPPCAE